MVKGLKSDEFCELCERRLIEHTSREKKDCKEVLELLEKFRGIPSQNYFQGEINE